MRTLVKRILVGLDGSPMEKDVLWAAREEAERWQARLVLFRAIKLPIEVLPQLVDVSPESVGGVLEARAREQLAELAKDIPAERLGGVRVTLGSPWRSLCEAAELENADLIVIGSHGYGGVDRLLGTTAARVVNHTDRSVLVVRP